MLRELRITDFAVIESLTVEWRPGMTILTGETGAGKSLLVDAVSLALGARAQTEFIRTGKDEARVDAVFTMPAGPVADALRTIADDAGLDADGEWIISRILSRSGRNRILVNGAPTTAAVLSQLGDHLGDIYGQNEHHSLLSPDSHLAMIDAFGGHDDALAEYAAAYERFTEREREYQRLEDSRRHRTERLDVLTFQLREITAVDPVPGEDEDLATEKEILKHATRLYSAADDAYAALYSAEGSIEEVLQSLITKIAPLTEIDPKLGPPVEGLNSALREIEDAAHTLRDYAHNLSVDPNRLTEVDDRLARLKALMKKYGGALDDVLAYRDKCQQELEELATVDERTEDVLREMNAARTEALEKAKVLTELRHKAGAKLAKGIEQELTDLAMSGTRFEARIDAATDADGAPVLGPAGVDVLEFYISPNPGEDLKPLARIASGGELSRIMLALTVAHLGGTPRPRKHTPPGEGQTLIFDEVDAGIGGAVAEMVGRKIKELTQTYQVLCVTHLPQIAAQAHAHSRIEKHQTRDTTRTTLTALDGDARIEEIARMLGGETITDTTRSHAREMVAAA